MRIISFSFKIEHHVTCLSYNRVFFQLHGILTVHPALSRELSPVPFGTLLEPSSLFSTFPVPSQIFSDFLLFPLFYSGIFLLFPCFSDPPSLLSPTPEIFLSSSSSTPFHLYCLTPLLCRRMTRYRP
jgi:hypothetical protein